MRSFVLGEQELSPRTAVEVGACRTPVALSGEARALMQRSHSVVEEAARTGAVYGRTTGVGANSDFLSVDMRHESRLLASHATTGLTEYPEAVVRLGLVVRVNQLARGGSGLSPGVADAIIGLLNTNDLPRLHRGGALGTGDLGALAELGLALGDALDDGGVLALLSSNA